jgi:hypothetical protein
LQKIEKTVIMVKMSDKFYNIFLGSTLLILGQILVWFLNNSQFVWEWWKDKPIITVLIYSMPCGILFWYGTKYTYVGLGGAWGSRLLGFGLSYITFPILTYVLLKENMFAPKTMICIFLSFCIVAVQIWWK